MKAIVILFDSLNKRFLPQYGDAIVQADNFKRLAGHTLTYENSYASSLPCIPARRDLHTGRSSFLHREWGPLEPYDLSVFELLKNKGIYTHLISDHYNYWEEGGCNYHTKYSSFEFVRGQEGDRWAGDVSCVEQPAYKVLKSHDGVGTSNAWKANMRTRQHIDVKDKKTFPQDQVFSLAKTFLERNANEDDWVLQIESFSPHEPFLVPEEFAKLYEDSFQRPLYDWPRGRLDEMDDEQAVGHMRTLYRSLITMTDHYLGEILDLMDEHELWKDTMLIVGADHGILLGEHGYWSKNLMPCYNEIVNTPFHIYDPTQPIQGERRSSIIQMIDWAPTLLDLFQISQPKEMNGASIRKTIPNDEAIRECGLFGVFSSHVNAVSKEYVYMHAALPAYKDAIYNYTLMPSHMFKAFSPEELKQATLMPPFSFTRGIPLLRIPSKEQYPVAGFGNLLFDNQVDREQLYPLQDEQIRLKMLRQIKALMEENDCPQEQYKRYDIQS